MSHALDRLALAATLILSLVAVLAGVAIIRLAPEVTVLTAIEVSAGAEPVLLDADHLGRTVDHGERVLVRRVDGVWSVANDNPDILIRGTLVKDGRRVERDLGAWPLTAGDRVLVGAREIVVERAERKTLSLREGDRSAVWSDGRLSVQGGLTADACSAREASLFFQMVERVRRVVREVAADDGGFLFSIGGGVSGPGCWSLPGFPPESLGLRHEGGRFSLVAGADVDPVRVVPAGTERPVDPWRSWTPVEGPEGNLSMIRIGNLRFAVESQGDGLRLVPEGRGIVTRVGDDPSGSKLGGNAAVTTRTAVLPWIGGGSGWREVFERGRTGLIAAGVVWAITSAFILLPGRRRTPLGSVVAPRLIATAGLFTTLILCVFPLLVVESGPVDGTLTLSAAPVAWFWATATLWSAGRLRGRAAWLWTAYTAVIGMGFVVQTQLAAGSGNEAWLRVGPIGSTIAIVVVAIVAGIWSLSDPDRVRSTVDRWLVGEGRWISVLETVSILVLIGVFVVHAAIGREGGLARLQPSELAKSVVIVFAALVGARYAHFVQLSTRATSWWRVLRRTAGSTIVIPALTVLSLLVVNDQSPILILGVAGTSWIAAFAWRSLRSRSETTRRDPWGLLPLVVLFITLLAVIAGSVMVAMRIDDIDNDPFGGKASERLGIYAHPERYPVSGEQVWRAFALVSSAPPLVVPSVSGTVAAPVVEDPRPFGRNTWAVAPPPEIENDVVGAFVVARFGRLAAAALIAFQALVVLLLFETGVVALNQRGDAARRRVGFLLGLALVPFAAAQAAQWAIAWSNVLGLLPVMGQPMSWVSSGLNHAVFFAAPCLLLGLIAGGLTEPSDRRERS